MRVPMRLRFQHALDAHVYIVFSACSPFQYTKVISEFRNKGARV
jgi:hypothetical protein